MDVLFQDAMRRVIARNNPLFLIFYPTRRKGMQGIKIGYSVLLFKKDGVTLSLLIFFNNGFLPYEI